MATVYISSTYEDLKAHRSSVYGILRKQHDVIAMEDYVATDERPLTKCLKDVGSCRIYVGVFAWRYGYRPKKNNPKHRSITELECLEAEKTKAERLIFLVKNDHPWPPNFIDAVTGEGEGGKLIRKLREKMQEELLSDFFTTPDNLAAKVSAAVSMAMSRQPVGQFQLPEEITDLPTIRKFGSTLTPEIGEKIKMAITDSAESRIIEVDIGEGKTWWSTRFFLLAALADEYTQIERFTFVDGNGNYLGMASPSDIRVALAKTEPRLELAYRTSVPSPEQEFPKTEDAVVDIAQNFRNQWSLTEPESDVKVWITRKQLQQILQNKLVTESVKIVKRTKPGMVTLFEKIVNKDLPLVPLVQSGKLLGIMDRTELTKNIAVAAIEKIKSPGLTY